MGKVDDNDNDNHYHLIPCSAHVHLYHMTPLSYRFTINPPIPAPICQLHLFIIPPLHTYAFRCICFTWNNLAACRHSILCLPACYWSICRYSDMRICHRRCSRDVCAQSCIVCNSRLAGHEDYGRLYPKPCRLVSEPVRCSYQYQMIWLAAQG